MQLINVAYADDILLLIEEDSKTRAVIKTKVANIIRKVMVLSVQMQVQVLSERTIYLYPDEGKPLQRFPIQDR